MATLRRLTRLAEGILAGRGGTAHRDEVVATLLAASADPRSGERLRALTEAEDGAAAAADRVAALESELASARTTHDEALDEVARCWTTLTAAAVAAAGLVGEGS